MLYGINALNDSSQESSLKLWRGYYLIRSFIAASVAIYLLHRKLNFLLSALCLEHKILRLFSQRCFVRGIKTLW